MKNIRSCLYMGASVLFWKVLFNWLIRSRLVASSIPFITCNHGYNRDINSYCPSYWYKTQFVWFSCFPPLDTGTRADLEQVIIKVKWLIPTTEFNRGLFAAERLTTLNLANGYQFALYFQALAFPSSPYVHPINNEMHLQLFTR